MEWNASSTLGVVSTFPTIDNRIQPYYFKKTLSNLLWASRIQTLPGTSAARGTLLE